MENNHIYLDYQNLQKNLHLLGNQCTYIEDTYKNITKCFNSLKEAKMQGQTADILIKICNEWDNINNHRLEQIQLIHTILTKSLDEYKSFYEEINKRVGDINAK